MLHTHLLGYRKNGKPIYLIQGGAPTPHEIISEKRGALLAQRGALLDRAVNEKRGLMASEQREHDRLSTEIAPLTERLGEIADLERRTKLDNAAHANSGIPENYRGLQSGYHIGGGETYHRGEQSPSFFKDLIHARSGDFAAVTRLARNNQEVGYQSRALGSTGGVGGSGAEFSPPAFLIDQFVALARAGRVTPNLFTTSDLPAGVSSINIPKVQTGTAAGPQTTQNTALMDVDPTTTQLSSGVVTVGGKVIVSRQLLDQSPGQIFDKMITADLAAAHAQQIGVQALIGTGVGGQLRGYLTPPSTSVITWTTATPTATGLYGRIAMCQGLINATRYRAPDTLVFHPRRWSWLASYVDANGRPLVVPTAGGFNAMANRDDVQGAGHVGTLLGMDCYTDANIPVNLGAGSNQDVILMFPRDDLMLWQSPIQAESFEAPYADSMGILFRAFSYQALITDRYLASLGQITGTGLVTPTYA